ncbi:MAG: anti-sigma factor family protein [Rhodomicrobiaceae bacterium]
MSPSDQVDLSNEKLVAYIDGELTGDEQQLVAEALMYDGEARERLAMLKTGGRPFGEAFDLLLDAAPDDKLQGMLAELMAKRQAGGASSDTPADAGASGGEENVVSFRPRNAPAPQRTPLWRMAAAAAILAFVFTGGLVTGGFFNEPVQVGEETVGWREAAARYVALFSRETLEGMPTDPSERQANLQRVETALGLQLPEDRISAPELTFQGTQLLRLEDKPLAQISYLHGGNTPVALCIISSQSPEEALASETRQGMNVVHWVEGGYGFMVIGDVPDEELSRIAASFRGRFS